jgi:hypothetical protein
MWPAFTQQICDVARRLKKLLTPWPKVLFTIILNFCYFRFSDPLSGCELSNLLFLSLTGFWGKNITSISLKKRKRLLEIQSQAEVVSNSNISCVNEHRHTVV